MASFTAGVDVNKKSVRSLYRPRKPVTEMAVEVETRKTPWNGTGNEEKPGICVRNAETCPFAGTDRVPVSPVDEPSRRFSSSVADTLAAEVFINATPV